MRRRVLAPVALAALLGLLVATGPAAAHSRYVSSAPAACAILPSTPSRVTITVSEAVQVGTATIRVAKASGARFDQPTVTLSPDGRTLSVDLAPSGPGIYAVNWTAVSAVDGHFTRNSFSYAVQEADGSLPGSLPCLGPSNAGAPVSPIEVALRFVGFLGVAIVLGVGVLTNFMWLPAGRDPDARASTAYGLGFPVLLNVGRIAAFAFAASMAGLFALATGLEGTSAAQGLQASPYVQSVALRLGLGVGLFALTSRAFARSRVLSPDRSAWILQACIGLALAAIVAGSVGTHAAAALVPGGIGIVADAAHLSGVGLWVGGLAGLVATRGLLREPEAAPLARIVFGRFSRMAGYAVALILAGGLVLALLLVGTWEALIGTAYGWVVLGKVALFAPMLGLGAFNQYRLIPKTAEAEPLHDAVRRLVRNVRFETALGVAVLALAGLLTSMTPAVSVLAAPPQVFALEATSGDLRIHLDVTPYPTVPGDYTFTFLLYNATTGIPYDAWAVNATGRISVRLGTGPVTNATLDGPHSPNHFFVTTALSSPGNWRVDVTFSRPLAADARATFYIPIRAAT
jgi:copper transport protein